MAGQSFFELHPFLSEAMFTFQRFCLQPSGTVSMAALNPYTVKASEALDREIHEHIHGESGEGSPPPYSSSDREAEGLRRRLKRDYRTSITTGKTRIKGKPYFARYGSDPSTSTEVLAETYPLSICRLALLLMQRG